MLLGPFVLACLGHELTPRAVAWSEAESAVFSRAWLSPEPLWRADDDARALPSSLRVVLAERPASAAASAWMASFGDCVVEHRRRGGTQAELGALLGELEAALPDVHARWAPLLREVLCVDALSRRNWDFSDDRSDDGIYVGPLLQRRAFAAEPWKSQRGARTLHQVAALVRADLDAILAAQHDYDAALRDPGSTYETFDPVPASIVRGDGGEVGPFAALRLSIRADLPFPFSRYDCDLGLLHTLEPDGALATHLYATGKDFYWFAGVEVCLAVETAAHAWVGTLIVRVNGLDLVGVPDGDADRTAGTRAALGHLKRRAEADYATRAAAGPRTTRASIPQFRVRAR